jgi:hypothetical protein
VLGHVAALGPEHLAQARTDEDVTRIRALGQQQLRCPDVGLVPEDAVELAGEERGEGPPQLGIRLSFGVPLANEPEDAFAFLLDGLGAGKGIGRPLLLSQCHEAIHDLGVGEGPRYVDALARTYRGDGTCLP